MLEVAQQLGIDVKRSGSGYIARCFAHHDTGRPNLSFFVGGDGNWRAHCHSCGWSGSVIDMVATVMGLSTDGAVIWLLERAGLRSPLQVDPGFGRRSSQPRPPSPAPSDDSMAAPQPLAKAPVDDIDRWEVFRQLLAYARPVDFADPSPGHSWLLKAKGIRLSTQAAFGIRWLADYQQANAGLKQAFAPDLLKSLGLLTKDQNLAFYRHRLLFPFCLQYMPVYVQGRDVAATGKQGRFMNPSSETPCLYNVDVLQAAREAQQPVMICEGATDTLTLSQAGYYAVGVIGVGGFKKAWVDLFTGLSVFIAFDGDPAGRNSAMKVAGVFDAAGQPAPRIVPVPDGRDVTELFTSSRATP